MEDESFDPALELDLPAASDSFAYVEENAPNGLDSLALELAQARDGGANDDSFAMLNLGEDTALSRLPATPPKMKRAARASNPFKVTVDDEVQTAESDAEAAFSAASASLEASLAPTNVFLERLRALTDEAGASAHTDTSIETLGPSVNIEALCRSLAQILATLVKQRDAQLRELAALDRALVALPPHQRTTVEPLSPVSPRAVSWSPTDLRHADVNHSPSTPLSPFLPDAQLTSPSEASVVDGDIAASSLGGHLRGLRSSTSSLLGTLGTLYEATQIAGAAYTDASRRLKVVRVAVINWRAELNDLERAEETVRSAERDRGKASAAAHEELRLMTTQLERAERKAQTLLA